MPITRKDSGKIARAPNTQTSLAASEKIDADEENLHLQALEWQVTLWSGEVSAAEQQAFQKWLHADEKHQRAWDSTQQINCHIEALPDLKSAAVALRASNSPQKRRNILRTVAVLLSVAGCGYAVRKTPQWQIAQADLQTEYGITQTHILADGSEISLNSATAVNLVFSPSARRLELLRGEILITTAANSYQEQQHRPFLVETAQGSMMALGTQFNVKIWDSTTEIAVFEGMVEIQTAALPHAKKRLHANQQTSFNRTSIEEPHRIKSALTAWTRSRLVVEQVTLQDFAKELERYRKGIVQVDPSVAQLRLSGSFPLNDSDQVLQSLTYSLPVKIRTIAPFWVRIVPA